MPNVKVAAAQFSRRLGDKDHNLRRAGELIAEAAARGARVVALPELFNTGYFPAVEQLSNDFFAWAETIPGPTTEAIQAVAAEHGIHVVAPIYEFEPRRKLYFNAACIVGPDGVVGLYRKRHIPAIPGMVEKFYFSPGDLQYPVFEVEGVNLGLSICYDRHFPETFRHSAIRGAEIVFSLNNTPTPRSKRMWFPEIQVAASSNGIFIVQCNACPEEEKPFFGLSAVIDPVGEIVAQLGEEEGVLVVEVDTDRIADARLHYGGIRDVRMSDFSFAEPGLVTL